MRFGTYTHLAAAVLAAGLLAMAPPRAQATLLTFSGIVSGNSGAYVDLYYDGGYACTNASSPCIVHAGPGPNYGITFSDTAEVFLATASSVHAFASTGLPSGTGVVDSTAPFTMSFMPGYSSLSFYYASEICAVYNPCTAADETTVTILGLGVDETLTLPDALTYTEVSLDIPQAADALQFTNVSDNGVVYAAFTDIQVLVPEPASLSLLLAGIGALAVIRRRKTV